MTEFLHDLVLARGAPPSRSEQTAMALVAAALPPDPLYRVWSSLFLFGPADEVSDIDLLVLGHNALYLLEVEHWRGRISGDGDAWILESPDGASQPVEPPLPRTRQLARTVKHALVREEPSLASLWIEPLLFVPNDDLELHLPASIQKHIVTPGRLVAVLQHGELSGAGSALAQKPMDEATARTVMQVLDGLKRSRRPGYGSLAEEAPRLQRKLVADLLKHAPSPANRTYGREQLEEIAAAWLDSCAFVCALEARGLLARSAPGVQPTSLSARDELVAILQAAARHPACEPALAPPHNPIWRALPSDRGARALLGFFWPSGRHRPRWSFDRGAGDSWSVLYQVSELLREEYALLVTPRFVSELLLDLTLTPMLEERGPDSVQVLDPACGSGTLITGAFERLAEARQRLAPGTDPIRIALDALDRVYGIDITPTAALVARIRLVLAYLDRIDVKAIGDAPRPPIHVFVADSLLSGEQAELGAASILASHYPIVITSPPFVTCKDAARRELYRERYPSASGSFSLAAPFIERCFQLAAPGGFVGVLAPSHFAKREFGRPLVERVLSRLDITRILDISGAYIPGYGTPTVILVGRNRPPQSDHVRVVGAKRGEPMAPPRPEQGRVWSALAAHYDEAGYEDDYIAVADMPRASVLRFPWSLMPGAPDTLRGMIGAAATKTLEQTARIAPGAWSGNDDVFVMSPDVAERLGLEPDVVRPLVLGSFIRTWAAVARESACIPHREDDGRLLPLDPGTRWTRFLWCYRTVLQHRPASPFGSSGETWWHWLRSPRRRAGPSLVGAMVSRSNEFALSLGDAVGRTAFIIELPETASDDDAFALLGYLNSSITSFWLKSVSPSKNPGGRADRPEKQIYEFSSSSLHDLPVPRFVLEHGGARITLIELARRLHQTAQEHARCTPEHVLASWAGGSRRDLLRTLADARQRAASLARRMVCDQEELDWLMYEALGIVPTALGPTEGAAQSEHRPFAWLADEPPRGIDPRLVEVWAERRRYIQRVPALKVLESPLYKRPFEESFGMPEALAASTDGQDGEEPHPDRPLPWMEARGDHAEHQVEVACEAWLLAKLEAELRGAAPPRCLSATELASRLARVDGVSAVATLVGQPEQHDLTDLTRSLLEAHSVPFLAALRHTESGLSKHAVWEDTWALQRRQDAGELLEPPFPPPYRREDYRDAMSWRYRGKLGVPRERFIAYPGGEGNGGPSRYGWAGWDANQRATALAALYEQQRHRNGWVPDRLCPFLAGLLELAPWVERGPRESSTGHAEYDYAQFVATQARELGLSIERIRAWRPPNHAALASNENTGNREAHTEE
jgi:Nuclease-related domain/N-6 DNA Methylase